MKNNLIATALLALFFALIGFVSWIGYLIGGVPK